MTSHYSINSPLSKYATKLLKTYLKFPENRPFTALDWKARDGQFLTSLTTSQEQRHLYAIEKDAYNVNLMKSTGFFHKVVEADYLSESKVTNESFSLAVLDIEVDQRLVSALFDSVDPFTMPDFQQELEAKILRDEEVKAALRDQASTQFDFSDMDSDNQVIEDQESLEERQARLQKKLQVEMEKRVRTWRQAMKEQQSNLKTYRKDSLMLGITTRYLKPGGILVFVTPKEMIDDTITHKLVNSYENIRILRLEDDEYLEQRKCVIIAQKRTHSSKNYFELGRALSRTKEKPYKTFGELSEVTADPSKESVLYHQQMKQRELDAMYGVISYQNMPLYEVPVSGPEQIPLFRVGPITAKEALELIQKSKAMTAYQQKYAQVMTNKNPITPTPLHKGHIMLLLTSGFLNGYIGTGPDQHLVKGSAIKDIREFSEEEDDGTTKIVEREFYNISVKLLDAKGKFRSIM